MQGEVSKLSVLGEDTLKSELLLKVPYICLDITVSLFLGCPKPGVSFFPSFSIQSVAFLVLDK